MGRSVSGHVAVTLSLCQVGGLRRAGSADADADAEQRGAIYSVSSPHSKETRTRPKTAGLAKQTEYSSATAMDSRSQIPSR